MFKYCYKCGHELDKDERFCMKCGTQINQNLSPLQENLLLILPKTQVRPGFSDFDLYITNKRIVAAKVGTILKSITYDYLKTKSDRKKLEGLNLDEILDSRNKNFEWDINNDIESIKIKNHLTITRLTVKLSSGTQGLKTRFLVFSNKYYEDVRVLLWEIARNKITGDIGNPPMQPVAPVSISYTNQTPGQIQQSSFQNSTSMQQPSPQTQTIPQPPNSPQLPPYCPICGVITIPNTIFCSKCGHRFNQD